MGIELKPSKLAAPVLLSRWFTYFAQFKHFRRIGFWDDNFFMDYFN